MVKIPKGFEALSKQVFDEYHNEFDDDEIENYQHGFFSMFDDEQIKFITAKNGTHYGLGKAVIGAYYGNIKNYRKVFPEYDNLSDSYIFQNCINDFEPIIVFYIDDNKIIAIEF